MDAMPQVDNVVVLDAATMVMETKLAADQECCPHTSIRYHPLTTRTLVRWQAPAGRKEGPVTLRRRSGTGPRRTRLAVLGMLASHGWRRPAPWPKTGHRPQYPNRSGRY